MFILKAFCFFSKRKFLDKLVTQRILKKNLGSCACLNNAQKAVTTSEFPDIEIPSCNIYEYMHGKMEKHLNHVAVECGVTGKTFTYEDFLKASNILNKNLRKKLRLQSGDVIAVILPNLPIYPIIFLSCMEAGFVVSPMNPVLVSDDLGKRLVSSCAKVVFTKVEFAPLLQSLIQKLPVCIRVVSVKNVPQNITPDGVIDFLDLMDDTVDIEEPKPRTPESLALLPFSSGTTSFPKAVELLHKNIVANICQFTIPQINCLKMAGCDCQDTVPVSLPMFHIYGLTVVTLGALSQGARIITYPKFNPKDYINMIKTRKPQVLMIVPPLIKFLIQRPELTEEDFVCVRAILSGAAPLNKEDEEKLDEKIGRKIILQGYGLTEASPLVSTVTRTLKVQYKTAGSIGKPLPNTECKIVNPEDNSGDPLPRCRDGELLVKGPQIMKGYYNDSEETKNAFMGEWLRTGDIGYIDSDGIIFLTKRLKEIIKVKGYQVSPKVIEDVLLTHPSIKDAAVIGVPDDKSGELPRALLILKPNMKINVVELKKFVAEKVPPYAQLEGGIEIIDNIPRTTSGKIIRHLLLKHYEEMQKNEGKK